MDINHPCSFIYCRKNMDFSCTSERDFLGCSYKLYENFHNRHIDVEVVHPYVIDECEGETIIYAESPEDALNYFFFLNGYTDKEEQKDFEAKLCTQLINVKRENRHIMEMWNEDDRYELVKNCSYICEEKSEMCNGCHAIGICTHWEIEDIGNEE